MVGSMHTTVLLDEAVDALDIKPDGVYVDGTFGRGGHSRLILQRLGAQGQLIALDKDPAAVEAGKEWKDERFCMIHSRFSAMQQVLQELGIGRVDGILLDLGMSSPQLETASRGFSFRSDGPLDMRMNTYEGQTAAEWLAAASDAEIGEVIRTYGEERFAKQIARAIVAARAQQPVTTTSRLAGIVATALRSSGREREDGQNPATRTFQAIRIHINQELEELSVILSQCTDALQVGGRLVVISFHSLEDRIVKRFMRQLATPDTLPRGVPLRDSEVKNFNRQKLRLVGRAVRPGAAEVAANVRSRSAVMRVAERVCG